MRNGDIINELQMYSKLDKIEQYRSNWKQQTAWVKQGLPEFAHQHRPSGHRDLRGQKKLWEGLL